MKVKSLRIKNIRGFKEQVIKLSDNVTILVGPNNSGKSTIIKALYLLQNNKLNASDIRFGSVNGEVVLELEGKGIKSYLKGLPAAYSNLEINYVIDKNSQINTKIMGRGQGKYVNIDQREPNNYIYPFLSKRMSVEFSPLIDINEKSVNDGTLRNLPAKIDYSSSPSNTNSQKYIHACKEIFGVPILTFPSQNGKQAGVVNDEKIIQLESMGDGTPNIVWLISTMFNCKDKLFLIEEIENYIHPSALKHILRLIEKNIEENGNQFVLTTHSHIVTTHLGSVPDNKVYKTEISWKNNIPEFTVSNVESAEQRIEALIDLGYDFSDYGLYKGWLFLEESTMETLIREYLIPWFVDSLKSKLRTVAGGGSDIKNRFENFNKLFLFAHLEKSYKNRAWVLVDRDSAGKKMIETFQEMYCKNNNWNPDNFSTITRDNLERYYPDQFKERVESILKIEDRGQRQEKKKKLFLDVEEWIKSNEDAAKEHFKNEASDIIDFLNKINETFQ